MANPIHKPCNTVASSVSTLAYFIEKKSSRYSIIPNIYCCSKCNVVFQPGCKHEISIPIVVKEKI